MPSAGDIRATGYRVGLPARPAPRSAHPERARTLIRRSGVLGPLVASQLAVVFAAWPLAASAATQRSIADVHRRRRVTWRSTESRRAIAGAIGWARSACEGVVLWQPRAVRQRRYVPRARPLPGDEHGPRVAPSVSHRAEQGRLAVVRGRQHARVARSGPRPRARPTASQLRAGSADVGCARADRARERRRERNPLRRRARRRRDRSRAARSCTWHAPARVVGLDEDCERALGRARRHGHLFGRPAESADASRISLHAPVHARAVRIATGGVDRSRRPTGSSSARRRERRPLVRRSRRGPPGRLRRRITRLHDREREIRESLPATSRSRTSRSALGLAPLATEFDRTGMALDERGAASAGRHVSYVRGPASAPAAAR